jgi:hypothetical protein
MEIKEPRYRYRFFLQNSGELAQTVVTIKDGEAFLKVVPQLSLITSKDLSKKDTPASTLAFFDEKTCKEASLEEFLQRIEVPLYKYSLTKTHIGYFYGQRLRRMKPAIDDPVLHSIAHNTINHSDGYSIMDHDGEADRFVNKFMHKLEIVESDFVPQLVKTAKESNGFRSFEYSIPPRLLDFIQEYNRGMMQQHRHFSFALDGDLRECAGDIRKMLNYYHNLREMYRFTTDYDFNRGKLDEHTQMVEEKKTLEKCQWVAAEQL